MSEGDWQHDDVMRNGSTFPKPKGQRSPWSSAKRHWGQSRFPLGVRTTGWLLRRLVYPAALIGVSAAGFAWSSGNLPPLSSLVPVPAGYASANCDIKGNISQDTGERIYHVPGQRYYERTVISPRYGERWFCSEADARAAGWRKAMR